MLDALSASHLALLKDQLQLETLSQNISNMKTPGYQRRLSLVSDFEAYTKIHMPGVRNHSEEIHQSQQGSLLETKNLYDLALASDGYFQVQAQEGIFYTRRGDFHINQDGFLATLEGALLLGKAGPIQVGEAPFRIDSQGQCFVEGKKIDELAIVRFNQSLEYQGQGLYKSQEEPLNTTARLKQGHLEEANVKTMDELLELTKISRHFEACQRVLQRTDSLISSAIHHLGDAHA